jgi:predicted AAA+ superfamily ATPase
MTRYINRILEKKLQGAIQYAPVIALTGPRQTGKSTMLKNLFPAYNYISFDAMDIRQSAKSDPEMFVENLQKPIIIDEIQYAPEIIPYIKIYVDKFRTELKNEEVVGSFILTGSQAFTMMAGLTESLAGRVAAFELLPFALKELSTVPKTPLACYNQMLRGFYPIPNVIKEYPDYYGEYLSTYIERDVRQIINVKDISAFQKFMQILANRTANLLNIQSVARDCAISHATAKNWLSILETSRIIYLLQPYYANMSKRLIKSPKIYFTDTGLLSYLLKYKDAQTLFSGAISGAIFENMMIIEALKNNFNAKENNGLYFYRDSNGIEIDLIIDKGNTKNLYEFKSGKTLRKEMANNFYSVNIKQSNNYLVSFNETLMPLTKEVKAIPWTEFLNTL